MVLKDRGLEQDYVTTRVPGLSQQALSALINRDSKTSEFAIRIADALDVSIRWLLDGEGPQAKGSTDEPEKPQIHQAVTSLSPRQFLRAYANLHQPGRQLLTRLAVSAGLAPGFTVEVMKWEESAQTAPQQPAADGRMGPSFDQTGARPRQPRKHKKPGAA